MRTHRTAFTIASILLSGTALAGTPSWVVSESSGKVSILSTGVTRVAMRGGALTVGDFVTTGANGRAVLVRGEEYLVVAPNSRIRVADPVKSGGFTQIVEHFGNVIYKIKKMTMPHFAVETPFLAAVVKGTTFSVTVTEKGATVQVVEGRVEVATRDRGAAFMVLPGDIGSVKASAPHELNVQGRENRVIASSVGAASAPVIEPIAASLGDNAKGDVSIGGPTGTIVAETVSESPVRLSALTGGLVEGDTSMKGMLASASPTKTVLVGASADSPAPSEDVVTANVGPTAVPPTTAAEVTPAVNMPALTADSAPATTVATAPVTPTPVTATPAPATTAANVPVTPTPVLQAPEPVVVSTPPVQTASVSPTATSDVPSASNNGNGNGNGNGNDKGKDDSKGKGKDDGKDKNKSNDVATNLTNLVNYLKTVTAGKPKGK